MLNALLGKSKTGREYVVEQALNNTLSLVQGNWKYIEPNNGQKINKNTDTELGNNPEPQLYNLKEDVGETKNMAEANPKKLKELEGILKSIKNNDRSRPL